MLRALIFDFDGVVADNEPIHLSAFQDVLREQDIILTAEEYYNRYVGYDDKGCLEAVLEAHGRPRSKAIINDLMGKKARIFMVRLKEQLFIFPGVQQLVREAATRYHLAIASGALRPEIEFVLEQAGLRKAFEHITSAEDVARGKPDPEAYLHALGALNRMRQRNGLPEPALQAEQCLVVEDTLAGIQAARAAGMKILAVANTHTLQDLHEADAVVKSLEEINLEELASRLWGAEPGEWD
jgi:HAD superfamily hydrolase (TIGR01509 family)